MVRPAHVPDGRERNCVSGWGDSVELRPWRMRCNWRISVCVLWCGARETINYPATPIGCWPLLASAAASLEMGPSAPGPSFGVCPFLFPSAMQKRMFLQLDQRGNSTQDRDCIPVLGVSGQPSNRNDDNISYLFNIKAKKNKT